MRLDDRDKEIILREQADQIAAQRARAKEMDDKPLRGKSRIKATAGQRWQRKLATRGRAKMARASRRKNR